MKRALSRILLVAAAAGMLAATAVPASAWVCKAKNAAGVSYTAVGARRVVACERALIKCRANSLAPGTCHVFSAYR